MKNNRNRESGQIIVLLAVSLVVLIIVSALAVDGGMIYSERRFAQNAADAASLGGAGEILHTMEEIKDDGQRKVTAKYFLCPSETATSANETSAQSILSGAIQDAIDTAISIASTNNFVNLPYLGMIENGTVSVDNGINNNHGVVIVCVNDQFDKHIDVIVRITSEVSTAFAHLIYPDPLTTSNVAITRTDPRRNIAWGNGIVSLSDTCQNNTDGMEYTGTGDITIYGGGIYSNSCLIASGNVIVNAEDAGVNLVYEDATFNGGAVISPAPTGSSDPLEMEIPINPVCSKPGEIDGSVYKPGSYSQIKIVNGTWSFSPGMYCLSGDFEITGGTVTGYGVTFFMGEGDVKITGNASVKLTAPEDPDDPWAGMLFYMPPSNPGLIYLVGTDQSYFSGTVFAPTGNIEAGGTSEGITLDEDGCDIDDTCTAATFSTQLIGWYVKVVGTSEIDIAFDETNNNYVVGKLFLLQ